MWDSLRTVKEKPELNSDWYGNNRFYLGTIANVGKKSQNKSGLIPNTTKTSEDL